MRISDWSSDVCSSDLVILHRQVVADVALQHRDRRTLDRRIGLPQHAIEIGELIGGAEAAVDIGGGEAPRPVGLVVRIVGAGDRKSVVSGKSVSGRVDLGGRRILIKQKIYKKNTYI